MFSKGFLTNNGDLSDFWNTQVDSRRVIWLYIERTMGTQVV